MVSTYNLRLLDGGRECVDFRKLLLNKSLIVTTIMQASREKCLTRRVFECELVNIEFNEYVFG